MAIDMAKLRLTDRRCGTFPTPSGAGGRLRRLGTSRPVCPGRAIGSSRVGRLNFKILALNTAVVGRRSASLEGSAGIRNAVWSIALFEAWRRRACGGEPKLNVIDGAGADGAARAFSGVGGGPNVANSTERTERGPGWSLSFSEPVVRTSEVCIAAGTVTPRIMEAMSATGLLAAIAAASLTAIS